LGADRDCTRSPQRRATEPSREGVDSKQSLECWPTASILSALQDGDFDTWKGIAAALKRDPYGRTAHQLEELVEGTQPGGISRALVEVLNRARTRLQDNEQAEVARHVQLLIDRSKLRQPEFASRIGVTPDELAAYLDGSTTPSAPLMIRMRRLSDRFVQAAEGG
jgi:hypothetical protein